MKHAHISKWLIGAALLAVTPAVVAKPKAIVVFYADDLGYGDTSVYGQAKVPTPNLERLAHDGCRFCDAHAATPICTPSRYSLLTGRYAFRRPDTRILDGDAKLILPVEGSGEANVTLPVLMKRAGYRTAAIGKWHLGLGAGEEPIDWNGEITPSPREVGFDHSFVMAATADRVPCVFIRNGRVVDLDPADPIEVSYDNVEKKWEGELTAHTNPELLKAWGRPSDRQHDKTIIDGISRIGHRRGGALHPGERGPADLPLLRHERHPRAARSQPALQGQKRARHPRRRDGADGRLPRARARGARRGGL